TAVLVTLLFHAVLWSRPYLLEWRGVLRVVDSDPSLHHCPSTVVAGFARVLDFRWVLGLQPVPCRAAPLGHWAYVVYLLFLAFAAGCGFLAGRAVLVGWRIGRIGRV